MYAPHVHVGRPLERFPNMDTRRRYYVGVTSDEEETWITRFAPDAADPSSTVYTHYLVSFYWALTTLTTVGYGDIVPTNNVERMYVAFALLIGALVFGYVVSDIGSMVSTLDRKSVLIEGKMDSIKVERFGGRIWRRDLD